MVNRIEWTYLYRYDEDAWYRIHTNTVQSPLFDSRIALTNFSIESLYSFRSSFNSSKIRSMFSAILPYFVSRLAKFCCVSVRNSRIGGIKRMLITTYKFRSKKILLVITLCYFLFNLGRRFTHIYTDLTFSALIKPFQGLQGRGQSPRALICVTNQF